MELFRFIKRQLSFSKIKAYSLKEVAQHSSYHSCWMVIDDKVYDFTSFLDSHPGGFEIMLEYAGCDATRAFDEKPHTLQAKSILEQYLIGELVHEDRLYNNS